MGFSVTVNAVGVVPVVGVTDNHPLPLTMDGSTVKVAGPVALVMVIVCVMADEPC